MGLRVVLDYRLLNHKSVLDKYSICTIDQCLVDIGHAQSKFFSCLDLTNRYWQLMMDPNDKHLTAFTIPGVGQFQWIRTPQGLMGVPASFSRLMDLIMEGAANVITYIGNVLIHSCNHSDHMAHLEEAIKRIQRAHLRLNAKNFFFRGNLCAVPWTHTV